MQAQAKVKQLVKILIGVAWIDGKIQPEERQYLRRIAQEHGLADDEELKPWLYELRAVTVAECYGWIKEFLGHHPTADTCNQLIEAVSGLIYSDGEMANEESKLVNRLLQLDAPQSEPKQLYQTMLQAVQQLYRRWADSIVHKKPS
jgi:uncharacterized tellurite resistance protein B-like protein